MSVEGLDWDEAVRRGRELAGVDRRNKWAVADLALEVFPLLENRGIDHANRWTPKEDLPRAKMLRWLKATRLEVGLQVLTDMRSTAKAWPPEQRVKGVAFNTHRVLRSHPERFALLKPGMTVGDVEALRTVHGINNRGGHSYPQLLRSLDASASFINTAMRALGPKRLSAGQLEAIGAHVAKLEGNLDALLDRLDMSDEPTPFSVEAA